MFIGLVPEHIPLGTQRSGSVDSGSSAPASAQHTCDTGLHFIEPQKMPSRPASPVTVDPSPAPDSGGELASTGGRVSASTNASAPLEAPPREPADPPEPAVTPEPAIPPGPAVTPLPAFEASLPGSTDPPDPELAPASPDAPSTPSSPEVNAAPHEARLIAPTSDSIRWNPPMQIF